MHRRTRRRARRQKLTHVWQVLFVVVVIATMQIVNHKMGTLVMPRPLAVATEFGHIVRNGVLGHALAESLQVFGIGFAVSIVSGIFFGILFGGFRSVGRVFDPFIHAFNACPRIAFIPLIIVWFGLGVEAKIIVTWISAVFPIMINTQNGIEAADSDLTEMARAFGTNRRTLFWRVLVPGALPSILTGLRIGSALAILGTVVAELYTAQAGLGGLLALAGNTFQMAEYFSVVVVLMALGVTITSLLRLLERQFSGWRYDKQEAGA